MAHVDCFLKIDGIEGESKDTKHKGSIEISGWSWGAAQTGTSSSGGGAGAGKVAMQDAHFSMSVSKASPKLMLACAKGDHIKQAVLTCRKAGTDQQEYLKYTFSDVLISSFQTGGAGGGVTPTETLTLNFSKIEVEYKEQQHDGTLGGRIKTGWDVKANKAV
jgi:type VI secretion system secreted protein Hcp